MKAPALEFDHTRYAYVSDGAVAGPLSLTLRQGEFLHASGESGWGKSTMARAAAGLIPRLYRGRLDGAVRVNGVPTTEWAPSDLTAAVGLVLQNPSDQMLSSSVENEIVLGLECLGLPRGDIAARLEAALADFGLLALRGRSTRRLSGGEQQRVALAAVSARRPSIFVLDEPLAMLSPSEAHRLMEHLRSLCAQGASVLAFEHRAGYFEAAGGCRSVLLHEPRLGGADRERPLPDLPERSPFTVDCRGLCADLTGRRVLNDVSFRVRAGEAVAVVGANGAGKTTLLRCLAGLMPYEGQVAASDSEKPDLYWVAQNPDSQIFNATVREELASVAGSSDLLDWIIDAFGLHSCQDRPSLLMSQGQKKRLVLGVAMLRWPGHGLLLDEPSFGQGEADRATLARVVDACTRAGQAVIVATHDLAFVMDHVPRVILLSDGRVAADGPTREVLGDDAALDRAGMAMPDFLKKRVGGAS